MSERKYTLMIGDVLTITFPRPTAVTVNWEPDASVPYDRVEAQTIESLRGEVAQLKQLNAGLNRQPSDYLHPELDR